MANYYAKGTAVFQAPIENKVKRTASMGFCVCICDNGAGVQEDDEVNAAAIARCLNISDALVDLKAEGFFQWIAEQKTLYLNKDRQKLVSQILDLLHATG